MAARVQTHGRTYPLPQFQPNFIVRYVPKRIRWYIAIKLFAIKRIWQSLVGSDTPKYVSRSTYEGPNYAIGTLRRERRIREENGFKSVKVLEEDDPDWVPGVPPKNTDFGPWGA